jgi:hypothetical protein
MRALVMTAPSQGSDRTGVQEIDEPRPGPGEVTIKVAYAAPGPGSTSTSAARIGRSHTEQCSSTWLISPQAWCR